MGSRRLRATGRSTWGSPPCQDGTILPPFQQSLEVEVSANSPVTLSLAESAGQNPGGNGELTQQPDYVPVLVLAWAYILSVRWVELFGEGRLMRYTNCKAQIWHGSPEPAHDDTSTYVDIGARNAEEMRWWAAVLAPGQGWLAAESDGQCVSPWSVCLQESNFMIVCEAKESTFSSIPGSAASFSDAVALLGHFCARHDIMDESHMALAAVLLLPSFGRNKALKVSHLHLRARVRLGETAASSQGLAFELPDSWVHRDHHIDRLLALSCNPRGIHSILASVFYEPAVECNLASPWLQGTVAAIDSVAKGGPLVLIRMFAEREPAAAFLWAGAAVLGLQTSLLQEVRRGQIRTDLPSAVWSGTCQTFIQHPTSHPLVADGSISHADEARLLFLSQTDGHARMPICQWRPFGVTRLEDVNLEVRVHVDCESHWPQYRGFAWDCVDDESLFQSASVSLAERRPTESHSSSEGNGRSCQALISYDGLDEAGDHVSENATRSFFQWLRQDGWPQSEKHMRDHEWFDVLDSDDEHDQIIDENECASAGPRDGVHIGTWRIAVPDDDLL
ncbi:uncharacterized protein VDAG_06879 [Verticillium dahliae VdLs.17]|uniref:Uncharacterized protein n=1 Tax=Verticillium dahliae (strain VdLs.17 / ATCC MYA-4575 / FGSC 10137) TaxID=498257 RepID=G2X9P7_VERDV|nr:uncharacterized protein VDAG_06879 [Verticillium dahliae VdLs.17]EGY15715.1 hypothetical protein VDAG_06879 [Verticillium dahliae VdLs.17]